MLHRVCSPVNSTVMCPLWAAVSSIKTLRCSHFSAPANISTLTLLVSRSIHNLASHVTMIRRLSSSNLNYIAPPGTLLFLFFSFFSFLSFFFPFFFFPHFITVYFSEIINLLNIITIQLTGIIFLMALLMISAFFWDITQRRVLIPYRRFGTIYRSHLQGFIGFLDPWRWDRHAVPKLRYGVTILRCLISQKSADLVYAAAEAWNLARLWCFSTLHVCTANMAAERTIHVQWRKKINGVGNDLQNESRRNAQLVFHVRTCKDAEAACCYSDALQAAFGVSGKTADISLCSSLSATSHVSILCLISKS